MWIFLGLTPNKISNTYVNFIEMQAYFHFIVNISLIYLLLTTEMLNCIFLLQLIGALAGNLFMFGYTN